MAKRDKKAEKAERRAEQEALERMAQADAARKRNVLLAIPALMVALASGAWFGLNDRSLAAGVLFAGMVIWLMVALGFLGSAIPPKDRLRANDISYGTKNRRQGP